MTEKELTGWVENCIRTGQRKMDVFEDLETSSEGVLQYKYSVAHRMLKYWFIYMDGKITAEDFSSSLRSYLLVWNTDIFLPNFEIPPDNPYGLQHNEQTGRTYVRYCTPNYLRDSFFKAAYMQGTWQQTQQQCPYNLQTNPFIYGLTGFPHYKTIEQKLAVSGALKTPDGYTTLVAMSTGGGKSLVTQTIAYQKDFGLTIVIVPTISLMIDQERNAKEIIHRDTSQEIFSYYSNKTDGLEPFFQAMKQKKARILFVSPEALMKNEQLRTVLHKANETDQYIQNLIIDEAHMIIDWGTSFRMDYQCMDIFQQQLLTSNPQLRTFLLSATYSKEAVQQLRDFYSHNQQWIELRCDRLRKEPRYCVIRAENYTDRRRKLHELVALLPRPMIIYVNSPDTADRVQKELQEQGITNTKTFTGRTSNEKREQLIKQWIDQEFDLMIATCAFGVGVDKKDIRTVLHLYVPENPNKYYQEAGRGGRDGLPCLSVMLYTDEDVDTAFHRMEKVLTTSKLSGRWFSMLKSGRTKRYQGELWLDTSVRPDYNDTDDCFSDASNSDISWNVYVILFLRRNYLLTIQDVVYQEERYIFKIIVNDTEILKPSERATDIFEHSRTKEWEQIQQDFHLMRRHLDRRDQMCWSEMFNDVYHLTEGYCSGCNKHEDVIDEESRKLPLRHRVPMIEKEIASTICDIMNNAGEMLVLVEPSEQQQLCCQLIADGIDGVVFPNNRFTITEVAKGKNASCSLMSLEEFFQLKDDSPYYLSGSTLVFLPTEEHLILRTIETAQNLRRGVPAKIIFATSEDCVLQRINRRLSELVDGPCKQEYVIKRS